MTMLGPDFRKEIEWLLRAASGPCGGLLATSNPARPAERGPRWETRGYTPGDDYRWIDWHIAARHDELVSRRPPAVSDGPVYVLVDCSRSMSTGRPRKFDVARRVAAVLGTAALAHLDQVAVLAFADRIVAELPPLRGRRHWLKMLRFLESLAADGGATDLARAAESFVRRRQRPGLAIVIGDFFAEESYRRGLDLVRDCGHSPCVVHVCGHEDAEPEVSGKVELCDLETGYRWSGILGRRELARYRLLFEGFCDSICAFCRRRGIGYLRVWEDTPWPRMVFELTGLVAGGSLRGPNGTVGRIANPSYKCPVLLGPIKQP